MIFLIGEGVVQFLQARGTDAPICHAEAHASTARTHDFPIRMPFVVSTRVEIDISWRREQADALRISRGKKGTEFMAPGNVFFPTKSPLFRDLRD